MLPVRALDLRRLSCHRLTSGSFNNNFGGFLVILFQLRRPRFDLRGFFLSVFFPVGGVAFLDSVVQAPGLVSGACRNLAVDLRLGLPLRVLRFDSSLLSFEKLFVFSISPFGPATASVLALSVVVATVVAVAAQLCRLATRLRLWYQIPQADLLLVGLKQ